MIRLCWMGLIAGLAALVASPPAVATHSRASQRVFVVDGCRPHGVKPKEVVVFCGDAGVFFDRLKWSSFGGVTAKATGRQVRKTCDPDCASGGVVTRNVRLTFSTLRRCNRRDGGRFAGRYYRSVRATTADESRTYSVPCPVG